MGKRSSAWLGLALAAVALFIIEAPSVYALTPWQGRVVNIIDGDSLIVSNKGKRVKVRLLEVDCPERAQPFGREASGFTRRLCHGKQVLIEDPRPDKYYQGRIRAKVILTDGRDLGMELVKEGLAWRYRRYSRNPLLMDLEAHAKAKRLGLWADSKPVPPWQWRKKKRHSSAKATDQ
jgi:endonuclease YncB( thermonuclease family)